MEKIKTFIKTYSAEILICLSATTAILNTLLTHEGVNAVLISILIALVAIAVEIVSARKAPSSFPTPLLCPSPRWPMV